MLKSELVISQQIESLDSQLKSYCISVLNPTFIGANKASGRNYEAVFWRLNNSLKGGQEQFRDRFIQHLMKEKTILAVINMILTNKIFKELNIDTELLTDTKQQITIVNKNIEDCCKNTNIKHAMLIQYYFNSLQLLSCFTAIRSSIATIKNICKKFNQNENSCVLKFNHTKKTSFAIFQQRSIIEIIEKILKKLFGGHLDIITVELDTGSPEFEITILVELDLSMLFSELFEFIFDGDVVRATSSAIMINAMLINYRKDSAEQLSDNDINDRILQINKEYKASGKFNVVPKRKTINIIEIQVLSIEEEVKIEEQAVSTHNECEIERLERMKEQREKGDVQLTMLNEV